MTASAPGPQGTMQLSVVMPVYNEEGAIALAVAEVQRSVLDLVDRAELVVVNDGSKDQTGRLLDEAAAKDPRIRAVHQQNRGHGGALMTGLGAAKGEFVFLIDSDRQIPLDDFPKAWAEVQRGRDAVFGLRRRRHDPAIRLQLTKLVRAVVGLTFGVRVFDANVPYKLLRRSIWDSARAHIPEGTLAPSLFLAIYARTRGCDIVDMDVAHRERSTGVVSIRRWKLIKFCARGFRQMLTFRSSLRHAS